MRLFGILILMFLTLTCSTTNNYNKIPIGYNYKTEKVVNNIPITSFTFISAKQSSKFCFDSKGKDVCINVGKPKRFTGSGFVVGATLEGSLVITAAHVCNPKHPSMKIEFTLTDIDGNEYPAVVVAKIEDKISDVCMLHSKGLTRPPVKLAVQGPLPGSKLYNVAAPMGIFNKRMVPILEGRYNGVSFKGSAMYSVPAAPGSSGSMVLNENFELVGMIHSLHVRFPFITVGPKFEILSDFIRKNKIKFNNL